MPFANVFTKLTKKYPLRISPVTLYHLQDVVWGPPKLCVVCLPPGSVALVYRRVPASPCVSCSGHATLTWLFSALGNEEDGGDNNWQSPVSTSSWTPLEICLILFWINSISFSMKLSGIRDIKNVYILESTSTLFFCISMLRNSDWSGFPATILCHRLTSWWQGCVLAWPSEQIF